MFANWVKGLILVGIVCGLGIALFMYETQNVPVNSTGTASFNTIEMSRVDCAERRSAISVIIK